MDLQQLFEGLYDMQKEMREGFSKINERLDKLEAGLERIEDSIELLGNKTGKHEMQIFHLQKSVERKGL